MGCSLPGDAFNVLLPLLRRVRDLYRAPERRQMGERAKRGGSAETPEPPTSTPKRAARVLPVLARSFSD
jgi:hypothetical protein